MTRRSAGHGAVTLVLWVGLAGCGGSPSPSGATTTPRPTPTPIPVAETPRVIDGWTEQPVTGEVAPPTVLPGQGVVVRAPGYLPREQLYTGEPVALWPGNEEYLRALVYEWQFGDGSVRMIRWTSPFTVTLEGGLAEDEAVRVRALTVFAELTRRTGVQIAVGPGGACRVMVDPHGIGNSAGRAMLSFRGASITGATVQFASRRELLGDRGGARRNTFLHEMGHVMGLAHSPNPHDVMTPAVGPGSRREEFHEREAIALHMMYYHREPGNRPPDRDPQLEAAMAGPPLDTVIYDCRPLTALQR